MRALSIRDPWATLIAQGLKSLEIRTWSTRYRGPLLICASARPDAAAMGRVGLVEPIAPGHAIAIAELVDVRRVIPLADDVEAWVDDLDPERHFAWVLRRVRPTKPFRVRGRLGLYDVDVRHSRASAAA